MLRSAAVVALVAVALLGCSERTASPAPAPSPEAGDEVVLGGETMGGRWTVKVVAKAKGKGHEVEALQGPIDRALERVNDQMSTYRPNSELSLFNRHASTAPFAVSRDTAHVVARALEIGALTDGALDVTLGPVIDLWGFDRSGRKSAPPSDDELAAARARVGREHVRVEGDTLVKARADLDVNLSSIAAGWAVDVVHDLLLAEGYARFMVEVTGEVRARGTNGRGQPWRIGVNVPLSDADPTAVLAAIPLGDRAVATSGSYRNFFESGGTRYAHIFDPKSGRPVTGTLVSVSVLAPDCATADALGTALFVVGEERGRALLKERFPGVEALFVHSRPGLEELKVSRTDGFPFEEVAP